MDFPFHSPHKFRHGFAVFSLKMCKDIADMKAVSMNLMHSNLSITDGVYGVLSSYDVGMRISQLSMKLDYEEMSKNEMIKQLTKIIEQLRNEDN